MELKQLYDDHGVNFRCPHFVSKFLKLCGSREDYFGRDYEGIPNRPAA